MCHKEARYFLCGHRACINTMYCPNAVKTGNFCRNPPLKPAPSPPINSTCPSCHQLSTTSPAATATATAAANKYNTHHHHHPSLSYRTAT